MNSAIRLAILTVAFVLITMAVGWWAVALVAVLWGWLAGSGIRYPRFLGAAAAGLAWLRASGPGGDSDRRPWRVVGLPWIVVGVPTPPSSHQDTGIRSETAARTFRVLRCTSNFRRFRRTASPDNPRTSRNGVCRYQFREPT
jgi:hypothetical protein